MAESIFDNLVFQAIPLGEPLLKWPPSLAVNVPTLNSTVSGMSARVYSQAAPLVALGRSVASQDVNWPAYCGLLKDAGIPLQASFAEFETLSEINVPQRIARRRYDEGFELKDLQSADLVLIDCQATINGLKCARLPLESSGWHELKHLVESLRQVVDAETPIGLNLLAGDIYTDVSNALAARVDYVVLEFTASSVTALNESQLAWSVVAARNACAQSGAPQFPIFIDAPLLKSEHLLKLLALGASAVSIDALLSSVMPTTQPSHLPVPKGLLSGIGSLPSRSEPNVQPLASQLEETLGQLRARVYQLHLPSLSLLSREHLRALDPRTAQLCATKLLEHVE